MTLSHRHLIAGLAAALVVTGLTGRATADDDGKRGGTTVQLPTFGVFIDPAGVLSLQSFSDPGGRLMAERRAAARRDLPADLQAPAAMRKVSLVRLERAALAQLEAGNVLPDDMRHLAGLQRVTHVFLYPDEGDVVLAGPAEGFVDDGSGRKVGMTTGRATIVLDDLVVALRTMHGARHRSPFVGCTISPTAEGLHRLRSFQESIPRTVRQSERGRTAALMSAGMSQALGLSEVHVFGVAPDTRFARTLVEADYRMKLIGIGLEPPPTRMETFIENLGAARHSVLQRWWFTPDYRCVRRSADGLAIELVGEGVRLLGEDHQISADGRLEALGGAQGKASERFTASFTAKYAEIADRVPVFAQLRNLIDVLVAAAYLKEQDAWALTAWPMDGFGDDDRFPVESVAAPQKARCAVNSVWKGNRLLTPAGGVSIQPDLALTAENLIADDKSLDLPRAEGRAPPGHDRWWWD